MSERYSRLYSLPENLYTEGAPVVITAGALLKDNQTGNVLVQLKLQNIDNRVIKAATVRIHPLNTSGKPMNREVLFQYSDLSTARGAHFGTKTAIPMTDVTVQRFSVSVTEIAFADNSKWVGGNSLWEPLAPPPSLSEIGEPELVKQFEIEYGKSQNLFYEEKDIWFCTCGAINHVSNANCYACQHIQAELRSIDLGKLRQKMELRITEEKAAERKVRKLAISIATIFSFFVIACFVVSAVQSNIRKKAKKEELYNQAIACMARASYGEAAPLFTELGDYKDSIEQLEKISARYGEARNRIDSGDYDGAIAILVRMDAFLDSQSLLKDAEYAKDFTKSDLYADFKAFETKNQQFFEIHYDAISRTIVVDMYPGFNDNAELDKDEAAMAEIQENADYWAKLFNDDIANDRKWNVGAVVNVYSDRANQKLLASSPHS